MAEQEGAEAWPEETIPVLRVEDVQLALRWYERLGFVEEWQHRFEPGLPVFASLRRGRDGTGSRIFLSEHTGDAPPNGLVYIRVSDVRAIAARLGAQVEEMGGRLEIEVADPFGNRIRLGSRSGTGRGPGYTYPADVPDT